jgi:hypothetical protein
VRRAADRGRATTAWLMPLTDAPATWNTAEQRPQQSGALGPTAGRVGTGFIDPLGPRHAQWATH